jgi:hypothetical protein
MPRDDHFVEAIDAKLAILRQAIAQFIPKAERNPPEAPTASDIVTKAADQGGPVEFARSVQAVYRARPVAQRHKIRTSQVGARR